jgi:hypothetical protein
MEAMQSRSRSPGYFICKETLKSEFLKEDEERAWKNAMNEEG